MKSYMESLEAQRAVKLAELQVLDTELAHAKANIALENAIAVAWKMRSLQNSKENPNYQR